MELIERSDLLAEIQLAIEDRGCINHEHDIMDCIRYAPTVDAVTVVRCGDCRHSSKITNSTKGERHCWSLRGRNNGDGFSRVKRDGFCDEGARMDADAPERAGK
jgi:hypothetical protein